MGAGGIDKQSSPQQVEQERSDHLIDLSASGSSGNPLTGVVDSDGIELQGMSPLHLWDHP